MHTNVIALLAVLLCICGLLITHDGTKSVSCQHPCNAASMFMAASAAISFCEIAVCLLLRIALIMQEVLMATSGVLLLPLLPLLQLQVVLPPCLLPCEHADLQRCGIHIRFCFSQLYLLCHRQL